MDIEQDFESFRQANKPVDIASDFESFRDLLNTAPPAKEATSREIAFGLRAAPVSPATPTEGGAAFVTPRQRATALAPVQAAAIEARAAPTFSYTDLYTKPDVFNVVKDYAKARGIADYKEGDSKEELVKQFMQHGRLVELNAVLGTLPELIALRGANKDDATKIALGKKLFDKTAGVFNAAGVGAQPGFRPYLESLGAIVADPSNWAGVITGGLGKVAMTTAAKTAAEVAAKAALGKAGTAAVESKMAQLMGKALTPTAPKVIAAGTAVEASVGAAQDVVSQRVEQQTAKALLASGRTFEKTEKGVPLLWGETIEEKPLDLVRVGVGAILNGVGGFVGARAAVNSSGGKTLQDVLNNPNRTPASPNAPATKTETVLLDPVSKHFDTIVEEFNKIEGRKILDEASPITALTEPAVQRDLSARAVRVALHIIENDPAFRLKPNQQTSSAIAEVFANIGTDKIDDAMLEQAINKAGLTPQQFAQANKVTVSQAAQVMQQYSAASKILNKLTQIDPEAKKLIDSLFTKPDEITSPLGTTLKVIQRVEAESKAWMVSGVATTVRNVIGTGVGLTYNSAASLIEGSLYTIGKTIDAAGSGTMLNTAKRGLADTMKDTFNVYGLLYNQGLAGEVSDAVLTSNPSLKNLLFRSTQEGVDDNVSKVAQMFNTLNIAQDAFFRKGIFTAAVDKHMRRAGLDMYTVIGDGKTIPASVLKQATDETLKATFSYMPKLTKDLTVEGMAESGANLLVKGMEFPGLSLVAPFARFMSNAMAFQYRYSVLGATSGIQDILMGAGKNAMGKEGGDFLVRQGTENLSKGIVGVGALAFAYDYRLKNQDVEWFNLKTDTNTTVDARALFPAGPTLAVADWLAKKKLGLEPSTKDMVESIIGMKMPAGTQNVLLDQIFAAASSEKTADKLDITVGKVLGDFTGRFTQPFVVKTAYDFLDLFREEGSVARDPNVITSDDKLSEAAMNRIKGKIPVLKEELPPVQPKFTSNQVYKEGEFFTNLVGVRQTAAKLPAEKEIIRLNIDPYRLYGGSTGDKEYDRKFVEIANKYVVKTIDRALASPRYQALSPAEQTAALFNSVRTALEPAKLQTEGFFLSSDLDKIYKMKFDKLPDNSRKIINEAYAKDHGGVSLEKAKDYKGMFKYEARMGALNF